jgi:hypothetical protein
MEHSHNRASATIAESFRREYHILSQFLQKLHEKALGSAKHHSAIRYNHDIAATLSATMYQIVYKATTSTSEDAMRAHIGTRTKMLLCCRFFLLRTS